MIRILIADDHAIFRQGLRRVLELAGDMEVVDEARNGRDVLGMLGTQPDVLLLDMDMPGPGGIELVKRTRELAPGLPILVLTVHDEVELARRAIAAGASGYLTKDGDPELLFDAIRAVHGGGRYVSHRIASHLLFQGPGPGDPHQRLSDREFQVFCQLAHGAGIGVIAAQLNISPKTVSTHKFRIMQKLGVSTDGELVRYALRHGLCQ